MSSMDEKKEKELIKKTLRGEREAFGMLVQEYQHPLLNYVGRMIGEREMALDFTQEVFLKAYSSLRSFELRYKFKVWLFRIASNLVIDYWRKKKIPTFSLDAPLSSEDDNLTLQVPADGLSTVQKYELSELRKKIEIALGKIPGHYRELFIWRHVNGLSYEEMAEIKNMPVGTIKNRVFQAKELIRRQLEAGT